MNHIYILIFCCSIIKETGAFEYNNLTRLIESSIKRSFYQTLETVLSDSINLELSHLIDVNKGINPFNIYGSVSSFSYKITKEYALYQAISTANIIYTLERSCNLNGDFWCQCEYLLNILIMNNFELPNYINCDSEFDMFLRIQLIGNIIEHTIMTKSSFDDLRKSIERHNINITVKMIQFGICKCVGLSSSCVHKTCMKLLPNFKQLINNIYFMYENIQKYYDSHGQHLSNLFFIPSDNDDRLIYIDESENNFNCSSGITNIEPYNKIIIENEPSSMRNKIKMEKCQMECIHSNQTYTQSMQIINCCNHFPSVNKSDNQFMRKSCLNECLKNNPTYIRLITYGCTSLK